MCHTWIRSVPPAVAGGCKRSVCDRPGLRRTHPLPQVVLTVSKYHPCSLASIMFQCKILTHKKVSSFAVVLEAMELREHQQTLHNHSLQLRLRESKIKTTREPCTDSRSRQACKHFHACATPINESLRTDGKHLQR